MKRLKRSERRSDQSVYQQNRPRRLLQEPAVSEIGDHSAIPGRPISHRMTPVTAADDDDSGARRRK